MVTSFDGGEEAVSTGPDRSRPLGESPTRVTRPAEPVGSVGTSGFSPHVPGCAGVEARSENGLVLANLQPKNPRDAQVAYTP